MSKTTRLIQQFSANLLNMQRARVKAIDYVMIKVPTSLAPAPKERNFVQRQILGAPPMSLMEFVDALERIADDPRTLGLILHFRGLSASVADLQTMRDAILRFREKGKRALSYAPGYRTLEYYVASACDEILLSPGGMLETSGLFSQQVFLKDGIGAAGLQFDSVAISPYKGAADALTRAEPSPEGKEQTNWLLDSVYDCITDGIAATRKMKPDEVKYMIDGALHMSEAALDKGYVDGVMNEEQLPEYLGISKITMWEEADSQVYLPLRDFGGKYIGLLYAGGAIIDGESQSPPSDMPVPLPFVGAERLGDITLNQQVRNLMRDPQCGALVLYIDSGGGSATASESMAAAAARVRQIATAGGVHGRRGGIGRLLHCHAGALDCGAAGHDHRLHWRADGQAGEQRNAEETALQRLFVPARRTMPIGSLAKSPFSDDQREMVRDSIERIYELFLGRVAESRGKTRDEVHAIAGGRVWTGAQALELGLVDELGSLRRALDKARELADMPRTAPTVLVRDKGKPIGAQVAEQNPAAAMRYALEGLELLTQAGAVRHALCVADSMMARRELYTIGYGGRGHSRFCGTAAALRDKHAGRCAGRSPIPSSIPISRARR